MFRLTNPVWSHLVTLLAFAFFGLSSGLVYASCAVKDCTRFSLLGLNPADPLDPDSGRPTAVSRKSDAARVVGVRERSV